MLKCGRKSENLYEYIPFVYLLYCGRPFVINSVCDYSRHQILVVPNQVANMASGLYLQVICVIYCYWEVHVCNDR